MQNWLVSAPLRKWIRCRHSLAVPATLNRENIEGENELLAG